MPNHPFHRAYDHRIRDLVCEERDPALFAQLGIPRSTAASWIRRGSRPVVTTQLFAEDEQQLRARVLKLDGTRTYLHAVIEVPDQLADAARLARQVRLEANRDLSCEACRSPTTAVGPSEAVPSAEREPQ